MGTIRRRIVVFRLRASVPIAAKQMHTAINAMTASSWFVAYAPLLAAASVDVLALDAAEKLTGSRTTGLAPARDTKLTLVIAHASALKFAVQTEVNAHPDDADAIATSASMTLRKASSYKKPPIAAKQSKVLGIMQLIALAIRGAGSYEWQMSQDQKTWVSLTSTKHAKTTVPGLTLGGTYYFQCRAITAKGPTSWTQVVNIIVS